MHRVGEVTQIVSKRYRCCAHWPARGSECLLGRSTIFVCPPKSGLCVFEDSAGRCPPAAAACCAASPYALVHTCSLAIAVRAEAQTWLKPETESSAAGQEKDRKENKNSMPVGMFGRPWIDRGVPFLLPIMMLGQDRKRILIWR